jgi:hypothetical protein
VKPSRAAGDGRPGRHRLDAAEIAAVAAWAAGVHADVAHVAGRAVGTAVNLAVTDDAAADAGADLDDEKVLQAALHARQFAQRHHVDVVVDEHRRAIVRAHVCRLAVVGQQLEGWRQHADFEAGGAHRHPEQLAEASCQAQGLGAAAAGGHLRPCRLEHALFKHACHCGIRAALRKRRANRQRFARDAARPEHMVEQRPLIRGQFLPANHSSPAAPLLYRGLEVDPKRTPSA